MTFQKTIFVKKHVTINKLEELVKKEKNKRIYERLLFIRQLYKKDDIEHACEIMCLSLQTGYNYLDAWNKSGYNGLIPNFGGGRPPKLTKDQKEELKEILRSKENWLTSEVMGLIKKKFGVSYSLRQVSRILRSFKMHYSKPYPEDYRMPENAKEILKERLDKATKKAGCNFILGFIDEASPQTTDNRQRFWSFNKSKIVKNTTKIKANTFGFCSPNGKNVVDFKENSKQESFCEFLRRIKEKNPIGVIIGVLDNFVSHISRKAKAYAKSLDIILVFLPSYSPNLNPIEQIWRCIRKKISRIFVKSEWTFKETIRTTFHLLAKKKSFTTKWLDEFMPDFSRKI
jgi:transposase